jgi:MFS superfamily sulfate permease-like transporter
VRKFIQASFGNDLLASVVVFLVALPLCMGIAIASGVPPAAGLLTGIVGGLVVGFASGAPLQVSGPAAGLTVLIWQLVQNHGLAALGPVVLVAGGMQLIAGFLRWGQWFRAISPAVIHGLLAGIGVLIFASQFHLMVDAKPKGSGIENLLTIPEAVYRAFFPGEGSHHIAAIIGLLTIGTLVLWTRLGNTKLKLVPAPLVAVVIAATGASMLRLPIQYVNVPESLVQAIRMPSLSSLAGVFTDHGLLLAAASLAFIASAETLLCACAVDQMHTGPRAQYDRELAAQGLGNMICGAIGALPMTGVIVRSTANISAGAQTRMSAVLHGAWILLLVAAAPAILKSIPVAALAAVLVYTGYKLVNPTKVKALAKFSRGEVAIYAATLGGIVVMNLLAGVLLGFGLALFKLLWTFSHLSIRKECRGNRIDLHLTGAATFLGLPKLAQTLESIPAGVEAHIHLERLGYIDHACIDLIGNMRDQLERIGSSLVVEMSELEQRYRRPAITEEQRALESRAG